MTEFETPLVIGYDGSDHAKSAIAEAGTLFPGHEALIVSVYQSVAGAAPAALGALPAAVVGEGGEKLDAASREAAESLAREGAGLARDAGLEPHALAEVAVGSVWPALQTIAEEKQARAVVVGSRGLSPLKELILGSTSSGLVNHCKRPVLVVRDAA